MKVWMNKLNAELCLVTPQWKPIQIEYDEKWYESILPEFINFIKGRKVARGLVVQVGWLLQNQNGVCFGVSLDTAEQFEDLGEA